MLDFIKELLIKIIPANWYQAKKECDIITKICDTLIELKWFVFPTITICIICICILGVYYFRYKIKK